MTVAATSVERLLADVRAGTVVIWDDGTGSYRAEPPSSRPNSVYADLVRRELRCSKPDVHSPHIWDEGGRLITSVMEKR